MADTSTKSNSATTTASSSRMDLQKWDTLRHQRRLQSRSAANKSQCNGSLFRMGPNLSATTIRPALQSIPFPSLVRQNDPSLSQRRALALGPLGEKCCVHVVPTLTVIAAECVPHPAKYPSTSGHLSHDAHLHTAFCYTMSATTISTMSPPR